MWLLQFLHWIIASLLKQTLFKGQCWPPTPHWWKSQQNKRKHLNTLFLATKVFHQKSSIFYLLICGGGFFFFLEHYIFLACTSSANSSNPWNILFSENVSHWQSHLTVHVLKKINWTFFPKIHIWVLVSSLFMCRTVAVRPHSQNSEHPWLPLTEIPGG